MGSLEYVTLQYKDSKEDVGRSLISDGLVIVEKQKAKWMSKLVADYTKAQEKAKDSHVNLWRLVCFFFFVFFFLGGGRSSMCRRRGLDYTKVKEKAKHSHVNLWR